MQDRSEEQMLARLLELESEEHAERRVQLTDERYLVLVHNPDDGRSYILRHRPDNTEGAEVPEGSEFFEFATVDQSQRAYEQMVDEARTAGELVEEDSTENVGDFETAGAEIRDLYADRDEDELVRDRAISEDDTD